MNYLISPKNDFCYLDRKIFQKNHEHFKCGVIWKKGSIYLENEPSFLGSYDPNIGISLSAIGQKYLIDEYIDGERFIYFPDSMPIEEQGHLEDIYLHDFDSFEIFNELGWHEANSDIFIFGELDVIKTGNVAAHTLDLPKPSFIAIVKKILTRFPLGMRFKQF